MDVYNRVNKVVAPKKIKLKEAASEVAIQMKILNKKKTALKAVSINMIVYSVNDFHLHLTDNSDLIVFKYFLLYSL